MSRIESSTSTGMLHAAWGSCASPPASGVERESRDPLYRSALDVARMAVRQVLVGSGFIDVTGAGAENFEVCLRCTPIDLNMEDLKPGLLRDLASWVASELAGNSKQALNAQANVQAENAIKLLA